ncbi:hypothetical protein M422DRAFT_268662 [Sphaerobolus stellatus SS14]|uniref:Uncharacterized protein n=1 Tax=Sphaerobolus stellatus (strain SS14) TaxID=990650 RepID=A0A0C9TJS2_SPHS4|nr:hypothetical protein M422DRAFT_268662 [Sphaerobolus stellatus SS14]
MAYNGHNRIHCLKYQAVVIPNGILANLYGPLHHVEFGVLPASQAIPQFNQILESWNSLNNSGT